ncbi:MAG: hypothetical protein EWV64_14955 [Microcystis flos-aquae Ma_QC_C_20070823_S18]|uniref:Uncharacterized protein n=1 Tax=Microcystis flos-aquae Mf_QC_C_20070823_S10D TaxID=2486236 RepID=A0A552L5Q6_9CHRO|nr:MAG: hypothetical protein EWV64_14955 [Microcystis flos-aquae Ma_QC_C_20070823_S18]TRT90877.1 MAG: hypothetical protein EWV65_23320 [Microcystis flos-aquae Ma_QC_C_20070823_S18D]TRV15556.1 MAG: hypothetical protein EWV45_02950 [Microcystis flos-aquae Mf_QC_C_20070823_S10D]TRV27344.1 MAG: hypothetical protein EWV72_05295 [Microcystis flos-aquae Mf_QC_C_20070823_S10]TRV36793.1 MAG: hypothetical protein EWV44_11350 [Microcystis flos-aquae Mf_QC_C_20070823_S20T]TRV36916.1 MAG: hypothetical prot
MPPTYLSVIRSQLSVISSQETGDYFYLFSPHPTPHTLHPTPYTPHPTPYTLHPTPHTLHPTP